MRIFSVTEDRFALYRNTLTESLESLSAAFKPRFARYLVDPPIWHAEADAEQTLFASPA